MRKYSRSRSQFWLKIHDDDDHITLSANRMVKRLVKKVSPGLADYSPTGWQKSKNHEGVFNLWIPSDQIDDACLAKLDTVEEWAEQANQHIWLGTNRNTQDEFNGDEVDYCLAADWNWIPGTETRTEIGEAEYQMKYNYPRNLVDQEDAVKFARILTSSIQDCINCLPFNLSNYIVAAIPAVEKDQNKLAWQLAEYTAQQLDAPLMTATLSKPKPQMKETSVADKISIWRDLLDDKDMLTLSCEVEEKKVLIVDDLYQSGASIWCFAEYLKETCGAKKVIAITPVKALKDGDNK